MPSSGSVWNKTNPPSDYCFSLFRIETAIIRGLKMVIGISQKQKVENFWEYFPLFARNMPIHGKFSIYRHCSLL